MREKTSIHHEKSIKCRENYFKKKRYYDDDIVFIKINFIEYRKKRNSKNK